MSGEDKITLMLIRGELAELPAEDQRMVADAAAQLRTIVEAFGPHGLAALALVSAEANVSAL